MTPAEDLDNQGSFCVFFALLVTQHKGHAEATQAAGFQIKVFAVTHQA